MEEHEMSPNDYVAVLKRRKWSLVLPAVLVVLISAAVALILPPVYKSVSTILIEEQEIPANFVTSTVTSYAEQRLQSIHQRIMSTSRLLEIITRLDIYKDLRQQATTEEVIDKMREDISLDYISAEVVDRKTGRPATATIAFTLSYEAEESPATVQKVANILASLFLEENLQVRERQAMEATTFLGDERKKVKKSLDEIEQKIAQFKQEHINELPEVLQVNLQSRHNVQASKERLSEQLRSLKEREGALMSDLANLSPKMEMEDIKRLESLKLELNRLETRFTDQYPDVIKTKEEIANLTTKIGSNEKNNPSGLPDNPAYINLSSQLSSVQAEIKSVKRQNDDLEKNEDKLNKSIDATPRVEETYNALLSERRNKQAKFDDLSQKLMEANVAYGLEKDQKGERFTLIDPARLPEKPDKPNRLAILLIGIVLGMGTGVAWAALREFSDQSVRKAEILVSETSFPVLASIPRISCAEDKQQHKHRRRWGVLLLLGILLVAVLAFHFLVMDLNVFWAKLTRRMM
ncbi:MAG: chain-length determining protein [Proteobacteria bacterium]|nr:chain-length determining protein [Pseudomonadota bacterium]MBU4297357.1 chain-length determining protein [Pseudomonadota bacterium]MCG2748944.1 Wzz/FepE/Etk N-terminal domain-containing protein [Desulfobulbaceae bacterium]